MPANELNLIIDTDDGSLYRDFGGRGKTTLSKLTDWSSGNTYAANLFLVHKDGSGILQSVPGNTDSIFRVGRKPSRLGLGSVTFTFGESVTVDADELTATKLEKALNSLASMKTAGRVDVSGADGFYNIVFRTYGNKATLTAASDLIPTASVSVDVAVQGDTAIRERLTVRFVEDACIVTDTWTAIDPSAATVTVQQDGASLSHIEIIEISNFPSGGSFTYSHTTTTGAPIRINATAGEFEALLTGKTVEKIGKYRWRVTWDAVGTATTGTTDSTGIEEFAGVEADIALNSTQLYSVLQGEDVPMVAEIVDLNGESYHTSEVLVRSSVGDEGPGLPSTASTGDMTAATYDPTAVEGDVFDMDNMVEGADSLILTAAERAAIAANTSEVEVAASYAAMRALTGDSKVILLLGDGGGWFRYDSSDASTSDDASLTIVRTGDSRRYKRMHSDMSVNVRWFGAVGDGTTDDYAAFQAALDTGHTVDIPNGTYSISATLVSDTSGQIIRGESLVSTWLIYPNDVDGFSFDEATNTNFPVQSGFSAGANQNGGLYNCRLTYTGGGTSSSSIGVQNLPNTQIGGGYNCESTELEDVQVENWFVGVDVQYASKFRINHCNAKACDTGFYAHGATNNTPKWHTLNVNDCRIGIRLDQVNGGQITLGDFALTTDYGILMEGGQCTFEGGELESFGPGPFFDITNSNVNIKGCRFLNEYSTPIVLNASTYANIVNCTWFATDTGHVSYIPAIIDHTTTSSMAFGYNGGLWGTGDLGNTTFNIINRQRHSDGTYSQLSYIPKAPSRDTQSTYTITDDWLGVVQQENYVANGPGGGLVSFGRNGAGVYYKAELARCNLLGRDLGNGTDIAHGWEGYITKDGGTLTLRDTVDPNVRAKPEIPKVLFVHNEGATSLTVNTYDFYETCTINGASGATGITLAADECAWFITPGDGNYCMVKSPDVSLAGTETLTNKTLTTPVIGQINDSNGNEAVVFPAASGAVSYLEIKNSNGSNDPEIAAAGSPSNIDIALTPKGSGQVVCQSDLELGGNSLLGGVIASDENTLTVFTEDHSASHTLSAAECYGAVYTVSAAATLTLPTGVNGMSLMVTTVAAVAVSVKAGATDAIILDGGVMDDGDKITNSSTSGDSATFFCNSAGDWICVSDGNWTDTGA